MTFDTAFSSYINKLQDVLLESETALGLQNKSKVAVAPGRKFMKVVIERDGGKSVHSFVEKATGNLYKPAGWNAPAKHVRYNLLTQLGELLIVIDPYGGYLYMR